MNIWREARCSGRLCWRFRSGRHERLVEDAEVPVAADPRAFARRRRDVGRHRFDGRIVDLADRLHHIFEEQAGRRTGAIAHDLLALQHRPLEVVDLLLRHQEQAIGRSQRAEDIGLVGRLAVVDVDRHLGPGEREGVDHPEIDPGDAIAGE